MAVCSTACMQAWRSKGSCGGACCGGASGILTQVKVFSFIQKYVLFIAASFSLSADKGKQTLHDCEALGVLLGEVPLRTLCYALTCMPNVEVCVLFEEGRPCAGGTEGWSSFGDFQVIGMTRCCMLFQPTSGSNFWNFESEHSMMFENGKPLRGVAAIGIWLWTWCYLSVREWVGFHPISIVFGCVHCVHVNCLFLSHKVLV